MDFEAPTQEMTSLLSNSQDALNIDNKSSSSSSDGGFVTDGGFVSGEEDFDTASERPADPDDETLEVVDAIDSFVGSSEIPNSKMPNAKLLFDDDEDVVEDIKDEVFEGDGVKEESESIPVVSGIAAKGVPDSIGTGSHNSEKVGIEGSVENSEFRGVVSGSAESGGDQDASVDALVANCGDEVTAIPKLNEGMSSVLEKQEVESSEEPKSDVLEGAVLGGAIDQINSNGVESADDKSLEADGVKFTTGGDSVVEANDVNLFGSGAAVVGNAEESVDSEAKEAAEVVEESAVLNGAVDHVNSNGVVAAGNRLMEADGEKLTTEGDSVVNVEAENVDADESKYPESKDAEESNYPESIEATKAVDKGAILVGEIDQFNSNAVESANSELGADGAKFTTGDSVVEAIHVNLSGPGAVVGDAEGSKDSEPKEATSVIEEGAILGDGIDQSSKVVESANSELDDKGIKDSEIKEATEVVEDGAILGGGIDQICSKVVESKNDDFEAADVKLTTRGDSVLEPIPVDLPAAGAVVVGDAEESKDSAVDGSATLDNGNVQNSFATVEPVSLKSIGLDANFDKSDKLVTNQTAESELPKLKSDVAVVGINGNLEREASQQNDIETNACLDESETLYRNNGDEEMPKIGFEPESDSQAKVNEPVVSVATDVVEPLSTGEGDEIQAVKSIVDSVQTNKVDEDKTVENDLAHQSSQVDGLDVVSGKFHSPKTAEPSPSLNSEVTPEAEGETVYYPNEAGEIDGSVTDEETDGMVFGSSEAARQFMEELEHESGAESQSGAESSRDNSQRIDGQIVTDSDEEVDTDEEGDGKELIDSAALAALLKAATNSGSDGGNITITSQDGSRLFSVERPAGLGSSLRSMKPAPRPNRADLFAPNFTTGDESENNLSEEEKKKLEKIQQIRVKFLRLVQRLGHSPEDSIAAQVLYRLSLVAGRPMGQLFSLETAKSTALQLEVEGKEDLDFSLNILVLGKTGVGKSATINSIFGEDKARINAFEPATTTVKEIVGLVDGAKIRVFDTPGLKSSVMEQGVNQKILNSIKKFTKKCPPDIVLYVDRLDAQTRDLNDLPLLKSITSSLGASIWRSVIVTLTHAASAPPDGPSGSPLSYEVFVSQRSHVVQQSIGQAVGDMRLMNPSLMNPVSLVENHPACRKNRDGQKVLPNGQSWRPQLLLLSYSMKILAEASLLSKPQDPFDHRKLFGFRVRAPPLPYLLSWLLQSRTHPKLSPDQGGENGDSDIDLDDLSDSDHEEDEDEYDQLPPFKPLRKVHLAKLSKEQKKAYFDEYDYRVKLLQKKQLREELKRMRETKKKGKDGVDDIGYMGEDIDQENEAPAAVAVPLPDMVLPPSFDSENPAYRYRFLEPTSQFLARPVLDTHGWDHDCGYDGVVLEQSLAIASQFPTAISVQLTKDKKEFNIHLDSSVSAKHGENGSTMAGFDIQNIGKQLAYIVRGETKFKNFKKNKTTAGASVTFLGENVATGIKVEDQITLGKRLVLVGSTGTVRSQGDAAYGANVEVRLREADFPIGQDQSTLGLSLVKWRGDLALGANLQSQFSIGRSSKVSVRVGLNNKLSGQITVRTSSSEQLQLALVGIIPLAMSIYKSIWPGVGENYSLY